MSRSCHLSESDGRHELTSASSGVVRASPLQCWVDAGGSPGSECAQGGATGYHRIGNIRVGSLTERSHHPMRQVWTAQSRNAGVQSSAAAGNRTDGTTAILARTEDGRARGSCPPACPGGSALSSHDVHAQGRRGGRTDLSICDQGPPVASRIGSMPSRDQSDRRCVAGRITNIGDDDFRLPWFLAATFVMHPGRSAWLRIWAKRGPAAEDRCA